MHIQVEHKTGVHVVHSRRHSLPKIFQLIVIAMFLHLFRCPPHQGIRNNDSKKEG